MDSKALSKQIADETKTLTAISAITQTKRSKLDEADAALRRAKDLFMAAQKTHGVALAEYQEALSAKEEQNAKVIRLRGIQMTGSKSTDGGAAAAA